MFIEGAHLGSTVWRKTAACLLKSPTPPDADWTSLSEFSKSSAAFLGPGSWHCRWLQLTNIKAMPFFQPLPKWIQRTMLCTLWSPWLNPWCWRESGEQRSVGRPGPGWHFADGLQRRQNNNNNKLARLKCLLKAAQTICANAPVFGSGGGLHSSSASTLPPRPFEFLTLPLCRTRAHTRRHVHAQHAHRGNRPIGTARHTTALSCLNISASTPLSAAQAIVLLTLHMCAVSDTGVLVNVAR